MRSARIRWPTALLVLLVGGVSLVVYHSTSGSPLPPIRVFSGFYKRQSPFSLLPGLKPAAFASLPPSKADKDTWEPSQFLRGQKTHKFEDNLREDLFYITSGSCSGFTNLFIGFVNMLYLASISDRIPILPPFTPNAHIAHHNPSIPFGEVFDLPRLRAAMRMPILEWHDVKHLPSVRGPVDHESTTQTEDIGCWSTWWRDDGPASWCLRGDVLGLDISYTRPDDRYRISGLGHALLYPVATMIYPGTEQPDYPNYRTSPLRGHSLPPNEHLSCFDDLYFSTSTNILPWEWWSDWSPEWRFVGRHVRFTEGITKLAKDYARRALGLPGPIGWKLGVGVEKEIPPFIAVHIRRGDFADSCGLESKSDCYAPLEAYAQLVHEVQAELLLKKGLDVRRVILASDEKDPAFWRHAVSLGWSYANHTELQTKDLHGTDWHEVFIDTAMLSMGHGFVGTGGSTFSLLASKRVREWNDGAARLLEWQPS